MAPKCKTSRRSLGIDLYCAKLESEQILTPMGLKLETPFFLGEERLKPLPTTTNLNLNITLPSKYHANKAPQTSNNTNNGCVTLWPCHLHFKNILRQKKNYGNSNISPCKNIIFQKSSERNQNPSRYYNSIITNLKFQHKPKYHLSKILI
jgi:hypothetical protein